MPVKLKMTKNDILDLSDYEISFCRCIYRNCKIRSIFEKLFFPNKWWIWNSKPEMTLPSISSSSAARLPADPMLLSLLASLLLLLKENKLAETELRKAMLPMPGRSKMLAPPVNPGARLFLWFLNFAKKLEG